MLIASKYDHARMTITRNIMSDSGLYDDLGNSILEPADEDIDITVYGVLCRAEPDVGIMATYYEDIFALDMKGNEISLTKEQRDEAEDFLRYRK